MHHWLTCPATYGQMAPGQKSKRRRISFCGVSKIPAIGGGDKCNQCEGKEETDPSKSSLVKCVTPVTPAHYVLSYTSAAKRDNSWRSLRCCCCAHHTQTAEKEGNYSFNFSPKWIEMEPSTCPRSRPEKIRNNR